MMMHKANADISNSLNQSSGYAALRDASAAANSDYVAFFQGAVNANEESDFSSYESSSAEEDEKLHQKVVEVNKQMGISYNKRGFNIIKRLVSRNKRRFV